MEIRTESLKLLLPRQPFGLLPSCVLKPGGAHAINCGSTDTTTTTTTTIPAVCAKCAALRNGWRNKAYRQCRIWGL